jgi:anti-sigma B factor antagonist
VNAVLETSVTRAGGHTVLRVAGEVDLANAGLLDTAIRDAQADGADVPLVVDLADLAYIDSAGLAALHRASRRIEEGGGSFVVVVPEGCACARTFEVAAFDWPVARSWPRPGDAAEDG